MPIKDLEKPKLSLEKLKNRPKKPKMGLKQSRKA